MRQSAGGGAGEGEHPFSVGLSERRACCIAVDTRPIDEPERIRLGIPPGDGVVMPVPIVRKAGFDLEVLPGEAQVLGLGA